MSRFPQQGASGLFWPRAWKLLTAVGVLISTRRRIGRLVGAYLAVGEPSAVAGRAALAMWNLSDPPERPQLVLPWTRRARRDGIAITRTRRWTRLEMVKSGAVRTTSMARTLLDTAPSLRGEDLEIALDAAHRRGLDLRRFGAYLQKAVRNRIPGASLLSFLVELRDPDRPIETVAESKLFSVLRQGGLPVPTPQLWVRTRSGRKRIDFAYPEQKVAIEFDGYEAHEGREVFDEDRARDNEVADLGFDRRHITWTMLTEDPAEVVWTVGRALGLEPKAWRAAPGEYR